MLKGGSGECWRAVGRDREQPTSEARVGGGLKSENFDLYMKGGSGVLSSTRSAPKSKL